MASSWRDNGRNTPYDGRRKTKLVPYKKSSNKYDTEDEIDPLDDSVEDYTMGRTSNEVHKCLK